MGWLLARTYRRTLSTWQSRRQFAAVLGACCRVAREGSMPAHCSAWRALGMLLGIVLVGDILACAPAAPAPAPAAPPAPTIGPVAGGVTDAATAATTNPYLAAPGEAPVAVKVATCSLGGSPTQLYTALEGGIFDKYGIAVERVLVQ